LHHNLDVNHKDSYKLTSPETWECVLNVYQKLKINFAHFGMGKDEWMQYILILIFIYDNAYADLSYFGADSNAYKKLERYILKFIDTLIFLFNEKTQQKSIFNKFSQKTIIGLKSKISQLNIQEEVCYEYLKREILKKIIFGTDFPVNLQEKKVNTYLDYIDTFSSTIFFNDYKHYFCSINPKRFMFQVDNMQRVHNQNAESEKNCN